MEEGTHKRKIKHREKYTQRRILAVENECGRRRVHTGRVHEESTHGEVHTEESTHRGSTHGESTHGEVLTDESTYGESTHGEVDGEESTHKELYKYKIILKY